jgi:hypothetical protein
MIDIPDQKGKHEFFFRIYLFYLKRLWLHQKVTAMRDVMKSSFISAKKMRKFCVMQSGFEPAHILLFYY